MGLSVGPRLFAQVALKGEGEAEVGQAGGRKDSPLDPLIAALGRAAARASAARPDETRTDRG